VRFYNARRAYPPPRIYCGCEGIFRARLIVSMLTPPFAVVEIPIVRVMPSPWSPRPVSDI